jgi:uncharacterized protein YecT (DUF1311 family)
MRCFHFVRAKQAGAASLGLVLAALASVGGESDAATSSYAACMAKAVSTRDMQACQQHAIMAANARLRTALAAAMRALPADRQAKLKVAQQQWLIFRQSDCEVFYGNDTGTIATVRGGQCVLDRTADRIEQLHDFSRPEGH